MNAVWAVAARVLRHRLRESFLFLVVLQPLLFCVVWGFCASLDLVDAGVVVLDLSGTGDGRRVERALAASGTLRNSGRVATVDDLSLRLASGDASLGVVVFPAQRSAPAALVVADGTDATIATLGVAHAVRVVGAALEPADVAARPPAVRSWHSRSPRSADLLLLGALLYNLVWFFAYPATSLSAERDRGQLSRLALTPLRCRDLWLGTLVSHVAVALWGTLIQVGLVVGVVGVPLRGHAALLFLGLVLVAIIHVNLGFVLAAVARTAAQRTLGQLLLIFVLIAVSGFLIPLAYLPPAIQTLAEWVPLTQALRFVRAVFLRGAGLADVAGELQALVGFTAATSAVALLATSRLLRRR
jgi:ABC-2 type transport system permease protein